MNKQISFNQFSVDLLWVRLPLLAFMLFLAACSGDIEKRADSDAAPNREEAAENSTGSDVKEKSAALETDRPYINSLLPEAQRIQQEYGIPLETTLAIAIHETGWGKFEIGQNNHFGLRCASDDCITLNKNGADIRYETCPDESECFNMFAKSVSELSEGKTGDLRTIYKNGYATSPSWVRKVRRVRRQVSKTLKQAGIKANG